MRHQILSSLTIYLNYLLHFPKVYSIQPTPSQWYIENFHDLFMVEKLKLMNFETMFQRHANSNSLFDNTVSMTPEFELIASELRKSLQNLFQTRQRSLEKIVVRTQQIFRDNDEVIVNTTRASMADKKNNRIYSDGEISDFLNQAKSMKFCSANTVNRCGDEVNPVFNECVKKKVKEMGQEDIQACPICEKNTPCPLKMDNKICDAKRCGSDQRCGADIPISMNKSLAVTPIPIYASEPFIRVVGNITAGLDEVFIANSLGDDTGRGSDRTSATSKNGVGKNYQYFVHTSGLSRFYPATSWVFPEQTSQNVRKGLRYDPRLEPWYKQAISVRKDFLVLLDVSGSMTGKRINIAKQAVNLLLNTLTADDNINIIIFEETYQFLEPCFKKGWVQNNSTQKTDGAKFGADENTIEIVREEEGILIPATEVNKNIFRRRLNEINPRGKSDFDVVNKAKVMLREEVAKTYKNGLCNGLASLIVITDGIMDVVLAEDQCAKAKIVKADQDAGKKNPQYPTGFDNSEDGNGDDNKNCNVDTSMYTWLVGSGEQIFSEVERVTQFNCRVGGEVQHFASLNNLTKNIIKFLHSLHLQGYAHNLALLQKMGKAKQNDGSIFDTGTGQTMSGTSASDETCSKLLPLKDYGYGFWTSPYASTLAGTDEVENAKNRVRSPDEFVMTVSYPVESLVSVEQTTDENRLKILDKVKKTWGGNDMFSKELYNYKPLIGVAAIDLRLKDIYVC